MPLARSAGFSDRTRLMLSLRTPMNSIQRLWPIRAQSFRCLATSAWSHELVFSAGQDLADAAGESTLPRLDQVADDLVGAPLLFVEVPAALRVKGCELGLQQRPRRRELPA